MSLLYIEVLKLLNLVDTSLSVYLNKTNVIHSQSQSTSYPSVCEMHERKPIEFYCEDDDLACCSHCVVKGSHRGHTVVTIEEKVL